MTSPLRLGLLVALTALAACKSTPEATSATSPMASSPNTTEHHVTVADIQKLLSGEGGVDLSTERKDGKPFAMRVFGVSPGSTAARLGAQNGDLLESVNDIPADAPDAMNQWIQAASSQKRLTVKGQRAGQPFTTVLILDER